LHDLGNYGDVLVSESKVKMIPIVRIGADGMRACVLFRSFSSSTVMFQKAAATPIFEMQECMSNQTRAMPFSLVILILKHASWTMVLRSTLGARCIMVKRRLSLNGSAWVWIMIIPGTVSTLVRLVHFMFCVCVLLVLLISWTLVALATFVKS
jgi:hypothetical protein